MNPIHHVAAEQAVLGTLLNDPKAGFIAEGLTVDDFVLPSHRLIFEVIQGIVAEGRAPTPMLISPIFHRDKTAGAPTALYLAQLVGNYAVPLVHVMDYVRALREYSGRRILAEMAKQMAEVAPKPEAAVRPFIEDAVRELDEIAAGMRQQRLSCVAIEDGAQETIDRLRSGKKPNLVDTGLIDLNRDLGGWPRGELTIIAGRPSMGKTTVALSALRQAARRGVSSLFFSMEMSRQVVMDRMLSDAVFNSQTPIHYTRIIRGQLESWDIDRLQQVQASMVGSPMRIDDQSCLNISEIGVRSRRYQDELERQGKRLDVICLDHLGYIRSSGRYAGQRVNEVGEISAALKELSKSLDVAVILLCQLSREIEKRDDKRPMLSDLRDSGNLEQDADTVIFAYRWAYYLGRMQYKDPEEEADRIAQLEMMERIVELIGLKTRNGPIFNRRLFADMGSNAVRDLAA